MPIKKRIELIVFYLFFPAILMSQICDWAQSFNDYWGFPVLIGWMVYCYIIGTMIDRENKKYEKRKRKQK